MVEPDYTLRPAWFPALGRPGHQPERKGARLRRENSGSVLQSDPTGTAGFLVVREAFGTRNYSLVHAFTSSRHPEASGPSLEVMPADEEGREGQTIPTVEIRFATQLRSEGDQTVAGLDRSTCRQNHQTMNTRARGSSLMALGMLMSLLTPHAWGKAWTKSSAFQPDLIEVYKEVDDGSLSLHIFYPDSRKPDTPTPAIVMFHGGGFKKGDPGAFYYFCEYLASRGMVAISAQYRLGDQLKCLKDAKSTMPKALVLFNPILGHHNSVNRWKPEIRKDFRPWSGIHAGMPPTLSMWGENDKFLSVEIMKKFQQKMTDAGVRCEIEIYPGQAHSFFDDDQEQVIATVSRADAFLASIGFLKGEPSIREWVSKY